MLDLRVRACHVTGEFIAKDNKRGAYSGVHRLNGPPRFEYGRLAHPPVIFTQERLKIEERLPAAQKFIREQKLNEIIPGELNDIGIIVLGGLTSNLLRALGRLDLADLYGASRIPIYVLNVAYPLVPEELKDFCAGKRAVLVVEEGSPEYVEQQINSILRNADINTRVLGKECLSRSGDYNAEALLRGIAAFAKETRPAGIDADAIVARVDEFVAHKPGLIDTVGDIPPRPPNFCTGCPERPVFAAIKLMQRELGPTHISADIGCHSFATFAPFSLGNSILGYGMSLASAAAVTPNMERRPISIMGDGGFWHNGLITGVASNMFNKGDGVLIVMQNGYASATGQQYLPSSAANRSGTPTGISIEKTVRSLGVTWLRTVHTYSVGKMVDTLKEAMRTAERGLKVIIADGECMLARQRRIRAEDAEKLKRGERVVKTRYGVDDEICTGDHSCIRLSGCPSLTVKPNPDPLRTDPVAAVIESCVGCGLCGEVAHAAVLCPSFYQDRYRQQSELVGPGAVSDAQHGHRMAARQLPRRVSRSPKADSCASPTSGERAGSAGRWRTKRVVRPMTILIAALGGEGGGVLTDWIVAAAEARTFRCSGRRSPASRSAPARPPITSRWCRRRAEIGAAPGTGAGARHRRRRYRGGERTDGGRPRHRRRLRHPRAHHHHRLDQPLLSRSSRRWRWAMAATISRNCCKRSRKIRKATLLLDLEAIAKQSGAMINAVMLGVIAGAGALPIPAEAFEAAIRDDGKAVDTNLRGFRAGFDAARSGAQPRRDPFKRYRAPDASLADLEREIERMPEAARAFMIEGVRRLASTRTSAMRGFISIASGRSATPMRRPMPTAGCSPKPRGIWRVRMSYEDVIRVAQAKIDPARFSRIVAQYGVKADQPFTVTEFLKPGVEEFCSVLPPWLATRILAFAERHPRLAAAHWGMEINTASISGFLRFYILAKLRGFRPQDMRFQEEQREIESWLRMIVRAAPLSAELAVEIAECARLIKGYGDTHKRGSDNYRTIVSQVIEPALAGAMPVQQAADAVASARTAALLDPEGEALSKCLADIAMQSSHRIAAE